MLSGRGPRADVYADDPLGYCREYLGVQLWDKQREVIEKLMTPPYQVLVRAGHNVGKTFVAACLASWFYDSFNPSLTLCTAPTKASLRDVLFAELRKLRPSQDGFPPKDTLLQDTPTHLTAPHHTSSHLITTHQHCVRGLTTAKSEAFQGRHCERLLLIYDEAVGIEPQLFEVGRSLFTGSPGQGWVCFYNPTNPGSQVYREESSGQWNMVTMSQFDHPNVAAELGGHDPPYPSAVRLTQVIRDMDHYGARIDPTKPPRDGEVALSEKLRWKPGPLADCRILGRWPRGLGNNVWSDGLWEQMEKVRLEVNPDWFVQIGCDVAAYGLDETAIVVKQGPCVLHAERHNGWGPQQTMLYLKELCHRFCGRREPRSVAVLIWTR